MFLGSRHDRRWVARQEQLLAAVPDAELERWLPLVKLHLGKVLGVSGTRSSYVYFAATAIVSLLYLIEAGDLAEMVGFEGLVGLSLFMGGNSTACRVAVQSAGMRLGSSQLMLEFSRTKPVLHLLPRYTPALLAR